MIGDVRGPGLFIGVDLVTDRDTRAPATEACAAAYEWALEHGLLTWFGGAGNVLKFKPPLTATDAEIDEMLARCEGVIDVVEQAGGELAVVLADRVAAGGRAAEADPGPRALREPGEVGGAGDRHADDLGLGHRLGQPAEAAARAQLPAFSSACPRGRWPMHAQARSPSTARSIAWGVALAALDGDLPHAVEDLAEGPGLPQRGLRQRADLPAADGAATPTAMGPE